MKLLDIDVGSDPWWNVVQSRTDQSLSPIVTSTWLGLCQRCLWVFAKTSCFLMWKWNERFFGRIITPAPIITLVWIFLAFQHLLRLIVCKPASLIHKGTDITFYSKVWLARFGRFYLKFNALGTQNTKSKSKKHPPTNIKRSTLLPTSILPYLLRHLNQRTRPLGFIAFGSLNSDGLIGISSGLGTQIL